MGRYCYPRVPDARIAVIPSGTTTMVRESYGSPELGDLNGSNCLTAATQEKLGAAAIPLARRGKWIATAPFRAEWPADNAHAPRRNSSGCRGRVLGRLRVAGRLPDLDKPDGADARDNDKLQLLTLAHLDGDIERLSEMGDEGVGTRIVGSFAGREPLYGHSGLSC
jgi:hypothetical protein